MKKLISVILAAFLLFSLSACGDSNSEDYVKTSESELYFYSSDKDLDLFLNDFYKRHSRSSTEYAIDGMELGTGGSCWKDWESMSLLWFDSTVKNFRSDSFSLIRQWIYNIPVDAYGYVWSSASSETPNKNPNENTFGMGWPFPNYSKGKGANDYEFNTSTDLNYWEATPSAGSNIKNGYYNVKAVNADSVVYQSKNLKQIKTETNPFLEFDILWVLDESSYGSIDDIYVSFKTTASEDWTTVKQSELCERDVNITDYYYCNHVYMPMYLNDNWGTNKTVTDIKIEIKPKSGKKITGSFYMNCIRANYDSRQVDNIFNFVSALKQYYEYTGDKQVLKDNIERFRKAVLFMVYNLNGKSGLVDLSNFVGHDGGVISDGTGKTIASSYWDVLSLSPKSLYAQVLYYQTLECALFLENAISAANISAAWPTIKLFRQGNADFNLNAEKIAGYMSAVKTEVQRPVDTSAKTGFFDQSKGRFIEGFNMHGDVVDYGSTIFNNMAVSAGLATDEQAKSVCSWINGDRAVEGDNAKGYTGDIDDPNNCGIYDYVFAPRVTTKKNSVQYTSGHANEADAIYGTSCQDGGAILFTTYYDLLARFNTNGKDDAFKRLSAIKDWYLEVYDYSAKDLGATDFYRAYYSSKGITLQGGGTAGSLGLDKEFLESSILYSIVPFAFFGLEGTSDGNLSVTPSLPKDLKFWKMENLMFHNIRYDLQMGKNYVLIESVRGNTQNKNVIINFNYSGKNPKVYVDGVKLDESKYVFNNNTVTVKTDFSAKKVEVK